jgi:hypothetical protein
MQAVSAGLACLSLASATIRRATGSGKVFCPTPDPPTQPVYTVDECCVNQKSGPGIERGNTVGTN